MHHLITAVITALALVLGAIAAPEASASVPRAPMRIVYVSDRYGFDWGDAGIGAAGGFGLSMLGLGGALAVSQRGTHRETRSAAVTR
jgi:hypothetical protein